MTRKRSKADRLRIMRGALTSAQNKYGMGGRLKTYYRPKPITLAKVSILTDGVGNERTSVDPRSR